MWYEVVPPLFSVVTPWVFYGISCENDRIRYKIKNSLPVLNSAFAKLAFTGLAGGVGLNLCNQQNLENLVPIIIQSALLSLVSTTILNFRFNTRKVRN